MAPANNFYTSSPTVVLPPNAIEPRVGVGHYTEQPFARTSPPNATVSPPGSSPTRQSGSLAGRKRSRGDIDAPEDDEESLGDGSVRTPPSDGHEQYFSNQDPASGMVVDGLEDSMLTSAQEPQDSAVEWEHSQREPTDSSSLKRPSVTSRKSQRMASTTSGEDDLAQLVLPPQMREVTTEPLIDEATRSLGISWTRMDSSEALRINQAAYGKWIQNHYAGLENVSIWFENSAIPGYLVAAHNTYNGQLEYYIFSNDLMEARLVTSEPSQLVPRLQMLPALHLAAPGGCIRAETEPILNSQVNPGAVVQMATTVNGTAHSSIPSDNPLATGDDSVEPTEPSGMCAAHSMELD